MNSIDKQENIKVAIRIRPFLRDELGKQNIIFTDPEDNRKIKITKDLNSYEGYYDRIFGFYTTQKQIFGRNFSHTSKKSHNKIINTRRKKLIKQKTKKQAHFLTTTTSKCQTSEEIEKTVKHSVRYA